MKVSIVFTLLALLFVSSGAEAKTSASDECIIGVQKNLSVSISITSQEDSYKAAREKYETLAKDIKEIARKTGLENLKLKNSSFNITQNNSPNFYSKSPKYNMSASLNYSSVDSEDLIFRFMEAVEKENINPTYREDISISYNNINCKK